MANHISLRIQSERGKMRIRITPNIDTFHAVYRKSKKSIFLSIFESNIQNIESVAILKTTFYLFCCTKKKLLTSRDF